nr:amyloid protein-binding protein 2 isoform X1 [Megalopta genalis]XP_033342834.1 amyloid protein-binding protein 2 isoform X1 [Megalopta genalis]
MAEKIQLLMNLPKSLYELSVARIVDLLQTHNFSRQCLADLPDILLFDVYYAMSKVDNFPFNEFITLEWSNLATFSKMLAITNGEVDLLICFELLGYPLRKELVSSYISWCNDANNNPDAQDGLIKLGLRFGGFLGDAGDIHESEEVLLKCQELCLLNNSTPENWCRTLKCCYRLLHVQAAYCLFENATKTLIQAMDLVKRLKQAEFECNFAALYTEFSVLYYMKDMYDEAYRWSIKALGQLKPTLPARITVDVLRQAAKSCLLKREFPKAGLLIEQAVYLGRQKFESHYLVNTNVLLDYGLYLLNIDNLIDSVYVYKKVVAARMSVFPKCNLHVALASVDLAYAMYVYEYNFGNFTEAREYANRGTVTIERCLSNNLLLANAKKVYALILEEIAIQIRQQYISDMIDKSLRMAEEFYLYALHLIRKTLGEKNVLIANIYGNLGRFYQTMGRLEDAETMLNKAVRIKEQLLGPNDYEVGLSLGHLASLYTHDMIRYDEAEKLCHRSIVISKWKIIILNVNDRAYFNTFMLLDINTFGKSYSGLEYDYRTLLHIYIKRLEHEKVLQYETLLDEWKILRLQRTESENLPFDYERLPHPIEEVIDTFFTITFSVQ